MKLRILRKVWMVSEDSKQVSSMTIEYSEKKIYGEFLFIRIFDKSIKHQYFHLMVNLVYTPLSLCLLSVAQFSNDELYFQPYYLP